MSPTTSERQSQQYKQFEQQFTSPQQVQAQITALPIQMVFEAREALQQVKESNLSAHEVVRLVEPVGRAIGWAEALVFALDKTTERDTIRTLVENGIAIKA